MTVYEVVAYWRSPHGRDEDGEPDHCATLPTAEEAEAYLIGEGFYRPLRAGNGWERGNWRAGIYPKKGVR